MKTRAMSIAFVVIAGILHWFVGGYFIFMGTVIDPQPSHVASSTVGFVMLLPFSAFLFVAPLRQFDLVLGALSGLLWGYMYLLLFRLVLQKARRVHLQENGDVSQ